MLAIALSAWTAAPAHAAPVLSEPVVQGLAGPLQFDLGSNGQMYVAQSEIGTITKVRADGTTKDIVTEPGEVAGIASNGYDVVYTFSGGTAEKPVSLLKQRLADGTVSTIAYWGAFEAANNPDGAQRYGLRNVHGDCLAQVPPEFAPHGGIVEDRTRTRVANDPAGGWYVADAAGNDILHVAPNGDIEVVKVPRPSKIIVTQEVADAFGLPDCVVGKPYAFEPVPTDVELNPLGMLIVSLLPGGPFGDDPVAQLLGPRGMIMRISPGDFEWTIFLDNLDGATNVAPAPGGRIYFTELGSGRVSVYNNTLRRVTTVVDVPDPAAVEFENGRLFVSYEVFGNGTIARILNLERPALSAPPRSARGAERSEGRPRTNRCRSPPLG